MDCLNCEKGCNRGGGTTNHKLPLDELEELVERRAGVGVFVRQEEVTRRWRFVAGNLLWYTAMKAASAARREATKIGAALELKDAGGDMETMLAEIARLRRMLENAEEV